MITGEQVTKARELLGWSSADLAIASNVDELVIQVFELGGLRLDEGIVERLMAALRGSGAELTNDGEPGVET